MKISAWLLVLALCGQQVLAVKDYLFKSCENSGFCQRNQHYASRISESSGDLPYSIDPESLSVTQRSIKGSITKSLPLDDEVVFPFELTLLVGDSIRFKVDEDRSHVKVKGRNIKRYDEAIYSVFDGTVEEKTIDLDDANAAKLADSIQYKFGPEQQYAVDLTFSPVTLTVSKNGEAQVVINERSFLNIEHYRTYKENSKHLNTALEIDTDMFSDSFQDSRDDSVPFGPESVAVDVTFQGYSHVYGIPEHADSFSLKDTTGSKWPYRLFNVDIFEYELDSRMPMYGAIPLMIGVSPDTSVGVFWVNSADTFVNVDKSDSKSVKSHWISENGVVDIIVLIGDTPVEINQKFGLLSGNVQLPQLSSLGYHQCRWNYNDEDDVLSVNAKMDEYQIPYDTIWLDIEYTDKKKYFTWNKNAFAHPIEMLEKLDHTGRNLVLVTDPHLKTGYEISKYLEKNKLTIKDRDNATYKGHCWPGESVWIDPLNPRAQGYWDQLLEFSKNNKFIGELPNAYIWNDMNEPSVFNGPETSTPRDTLHYGDWEHRSVHNLWGKSFHELTYKSLLKRLEATNRQRPFVLTRSFFAGSQRTAAMWTGDNMAKWDHLKASIPMVLTLNAVNMPFSGADVGGFFGNPTSELLARWYQTGIWYPFFRAHAHIDSRRREPWVVGEPYTSVMRDAVRLRYALLPTLYTLFAEASESGAPIWKSLVFDNPHDVGAYDIDDQFYLGSSGLLVKPVTEENAKSVSVYLPGDEVFYDYTNGQFSSKGSVVAKPTQQTYVKNVALGDIPLFIRGGSIFARKDRYRRSSRLMKSDPYHLVVALDTKGHAEGKLYVDDGDSFEYKNGKSMLAVFEAHEGEISGLAVVGDSEYAAEMKKLLVERITVAGYTAPVGRVTVTQNDDTWTCGFVQHKDYVEVVNPRFTIGATWTVQFHEPETHDEL